MSLRNYAVLVLVLLHAGFTLGAPAQRPLVERLEFEASYRGPLAADEKITDCQPVPGNQGDQLAGIRRPLV